MFFWFFFQFVRKVCKEDMFKWTAAKLSKTMERFIRINNAINIEEIYFQVTKKT